MSERQPSPLREPDVIQHADSAELQRVVPVELISRSEAQYLPGKSLFDDLDKTRVELWNARDELKQAHESARVDVLTGLKNRRALNRDVEQFAEYARRHPGVSYWVLAIDGNKFKDINDTYGHAKGDEVLAAVGEVLLSAFHNPVDEAYRTGGDEFAAVLAGSDDISNEELEEKLSSRLNDALAEVLAANNLPEVTLALGVSKWDADSAQSWDEAFMQADERLYAVKQTQASELEEIQQRAPAA